MLSKRRNICRFAVIESALVLPMKATAAFIKPTFSVCYPLIKKRWFAKLQFDSLRIRKDFFEKYYRDSAAITKENMIAFLLANSDYAMKESIGACTAKVLILVGGKEAHKMKQSAEILSNTIHNSKLEVLPGFYHGDLSINHPKLYVEKI